MDDDDALMRRLFEATPDALWLLDLDGGTLLANQRLADLIGHPLESMSGVTGYDVADERGRAEFERHLEDMRAGHPGVSNEDVRIVRSDGTRIWALASWAPVPSADGTGIVGYLHRLTEHTERVHLLETLRERQVLLANAHRIARLGSWTWDLTTDHVEWSPELFAVHGVSPERFRPSYGAFLQLIHPDDRAGFQDRILEAIHQQDRYVHEGRAVTESGEVRWIRTVGEVERDEDDAVVAFNGTSQDVTERRQALEAANTATRRLHLLQQLAQAANRSTTLADALARSAQLLVGSTEWIPLCVVTRPERGAPLTVRQLPGPVAPDLPPPDLEAAAECWSTRETVLTALPDRPGRMLVSLPVQAGRPMACVVQVLAAVDEPEDAYTWALLAQVRDQLSSVAERERAAAQLKEARDQAMAASRHKSDFLATMSHEIRTPMNGVIGLTDLLLRTGLDHRQRRLADGLRGAGLTLLSIINDILDLAKIESGKLELEVIEFDVRHVVDETAMILTGPAVDKGLELVVGCSPEVPRLLRGDPVRLGQVLTNLGGNAVKFTEAGEVVIDVKLEPPTPYDDPSAVTLRVEVHDTGIGIDDADIEGLFEAFTQADRSTTRQHGGTGLGLAISRQLVDGMGGRIGARSALGTGSVFWFTARFGVLTDDEATLPPAEPPLRRRRVLVVSDHPSTASFLVRQLSAWQLQVDQAGTVEEALTALRGAGDAGAPFDVALVDLAPAGLTSLELGRRAGEDRALDDVALVLVAGEGAMTDDEVRAAGYSVRVAKPVRTSELHAALIDAPDPDTETTDRAQGPDQPALGRYVLVVEDNAVNQLVAVGLLENLGCTVAAVANGAEAVDALAEGHDYDIVLMDCRMPRMDGFDATRAIRTTEAGRTRVPIIAMTASALPGERDRCLAAGMDDFLTKPVDPSQLAAAIVRAGVSPRNGSAAPVSFTPTRGPATGALDLSRVELLSELVKDGVSFFERTRTSFLSRVDGALAQISIAVADGDAERTAADAHQLRGSALNIGLARVGAAAEAVEELARTGDLTGMGDLVVRLRDAVAEGVDALTAVRPAPGPGDGAA